MTGRYHAIIGACAAVITAAPFYTSGTSFPTTVIALGTLGGLLPDVDDPSSLLGRCLPFGSCQSRNGTRHGRTIFGYQVWHRDQFHGIGMGLFFAMPVAVVLGLLPALALLAGFLSHLACDHISPSPMMLLWPFSAGRYRVPVPALASGTILFTLAETATTAAALYLAARVLALV